MNEEISNEEDQKGRVQSTKSGIKKKNRKPHGYKQFDGKSIKKPFHVIEKCQEFTSTIYKYTAKAETEYRRTICKTLQKKCRKLIHSARRANDEEVGTKRREKAHEKSMKYLEEINDLLPVVRRLHCITPNQELEMQNKYFTLWNAYIAWIASDEKRNSGAVKNE